MSNQKFPWHVTYTYGVDGRVMVGSSTLTKSDKSLLNKDDLEGIADHVKRTHRADIAVVTFFARMQTITESDEVSHE